MERKRRTAAVNKDLSKPIIDIAILGTDNDPCFGKHYDLTAEECTGCGDIEACSMVFLQKQGVRRLEEEHKNSNLDLEMDKLERTQQIENYIIERKARGMKRMLIITRAMKRFRISKENLLIIYNTTNGH